MSKIEWTGETWNPIIGCDKVSAGCKNCYAIQTAWIRQHNPAMAEKYAGVVKKTAAGQLNWTGKINMHVPSLLKPLLTKKPTTYFVNSMSDFFHPGVTDRFRDKMFAVMALCPQHTFQILTKRHKEMLEYFKDRDDSEFFEQETDELVCNELHLVFAEDWYKDESGKKQYTIGSNLSQKLLAAGWSIDYDYDDDGKRDGWDLIYEGKYPLPNVWIGVSVEDQKAADDRIPILLQVPAAVRFLSCEPLLGPVDISKYMIPAGVHHHPDNTLTGETGVALNALVNKINPNLPKYLHWVIVGGESGKDARPMHPDWARSLRDQCQAAGVSFFFKQWGEYAEGAKGNVPSSKWYMVYNNGELLKNGAIEPGRHAVMMSKMGKKKSGRLLDGREWNEMPKQKTI